MSNGGPLLIDRYLGALCLRRLTLVWPALAALAVLSQAARLGHRVIGSNVGFDELLVAFALGLLPGAIATAPIAIAVAVSWTIANLASRGEIEAMLTAGMPPWRMAVPPVALALLVGLATEAMLVLAPATAAPLQHKVTSMMVRATAARMRSGKIERLGADAIALSGDGFVLVRRSPIAIAARDAKPAANGSSLRLRFTDGEAHAGTLATLPFEEMDSTIDLSGATQRHAAFLSRGATAAPLWSVALSTCVIAILLQLRGRPWVQLGLSGLVTGVYAIAAAASLWVPFVVAVCSAWSLARR